MLWGAVDGEEKVAGTPVVATWSEDTGLTARLNPEVAHYTGQAEIAASIRDGLEARDRGDDAGATRLLGNAARLAAASTLALAVLSNAAPVAQPVAQRQLSSLPDILTGLLTQLTPVTDLLCASPASSSLSPSRARAHPSPAPHPPP